MITALDLLVPVLLPLALGSADPAPTTATQDQAELRHAILAGPAGRLEARASSHGYRALFDGRGLVVQGGDWCFGLELERIGRDGSRRVVTAPRSVDHAGRRVEYDWDAGLVEWFVNRDRGLEHGFDLAVRPAGDGEGDGDLVLELALTTELVPQVTQDERSLRFAHPDGRHAVDYAGLVAFDSRGTDLDARFVLDGELLSIHVDDAGAQYPITIDPIVQSEYIKPSNTDANDRFATSVAIFSTTAVVGAPREDGAGGTGSNPASNGLDDAGAAFVFRRTSSGWIQEAYLKAPSRDLSDLFGASVDIGKNRIVVGAIGEDSGATFVDGSTSDDSVSGAGAAYVFNKSGGVWTLEAYLKSPSPDINDRFGTSVAIEGDTVVVGAPEEDGGSTGVNGNWFDNSAFDAGAAYVYRRGATNWVFDSYLKASNAQGGDEFGADVAITTDALGVETIVVGAALEDGAGTGSTSPDLANAAGNAGAAYVFVNSGSGWSEQAYLKATNTDANDFFGMSVDVDGDTLVVGAPFEDSSASGANGSQSDNSLNAPGAAYVYQRSGSSWFSVAYLKPDVPEASDLFGSSVAISQGVIAVAATGEDGGVPGVDGDSTDNSESAAGAVFLFTPIGLTWEPRAYVKASNPGSGDEFGRSLAIDGEDLLVGAPFEDSAGVGVGASQTSDTASASGALYVFDIGFWELVPGCFANPATILPPSRSAYLGEDFHFTVQTSSITTGVSASFFGALGVDGSGCGTLIGLGEEVLLGLAPFPKLIGVAPVSGGTAGQDLPIPDAPSLVGIRATIQAVAVDTLTFASEFSQGLEIEIRP